MALPGLPLGGKAAPDFRLVDQFGRGDDLAKFRGSVVLLTFIDSHCTTVCPITSALLLRTADLLGSNASRVQLLAVNANPEHTKVADVRRWSLEHRMLHRWLFLTGSPARLRAVWRSYGVEAKVVHGDVDHTAVVVVIDPQGREETAVPIATKAGIGTEAGALADAVRRLLRSRG